MKAHVILGLMAGCIAFQCRL